MPATKKPLSKKNQATLRRYLALNPDKYDLMLFGRYSRRYLIAASNGAEVSKYAAEMLRDSCAELREIVRGQKPVLFREGR